MATIYCLSVISVNYDLLAESAFANPCVICYTDAADDDATKDRYARLGEHNDESHGAPFESPG